jgi:hypothetical protein
MWLYLFNYFLVLSVTVLFGLRFHSVFATVLGITSSPGGFDIGSQFAQRAVVIGCASSGIGSAVDAYFWIRYVGSDVERFQVRHPSSLFASCSLTQNNTDNGSRRIRLLLLLLRLCQSSRFMPRRIVRLADGVPPCRLVPRLACGCAGHVFLSGPAVDSAVHRLWAGLGAEAYCECCEGDEERRAKDRGEVGLAEGWKGFGAETCSCSCPRHRFKLRLSEQKGV